MGFNFPNSPTVGQKWPASPIAGQPTYTWDGEKWTTVTGSILAGAVRYDLAQGLTAPQQAQGAANISSLTYAAQVLTAPQQQQARQNIYAAPFDAEAVNGIQINGAFEVNQLAIASNNINVGYFCDSWMLHANGAAGLVVTATQVTTQPTLFPGLPNFAAITVQTPTVTLTGNDGCGIYGRVENWRLARLAWGTANAQPVTFGFWTCHHRPGIYTLSMRGPASYVAAYTHAVADVPQYNVITIPGCTGGTWPVDNSFALAITFSVGYGPTLQAPSLNTWYVGGNYTSHASAVNGCAATTDVFRVAGVIMLPGLEAPSAARSPFIMRLYDTELILCKRQLQKIGGDTAHDCQFYRPYVTPAGTLINMTFYYPEMRAIPAVSLIGAWTATNFTPASTEFYAGKTSCVVSGTAPAVGASFLDNPVGAYIRLDARL